MNCAIAVKLYECEDCFFFFFSVSCIKGGGQFSVVS